MAGDSFEELRVVRVGCADVFEGFDTFGGVAPAAAVFVGDDELVLVVSEAALEGELGIRGGYVWGSAAKGSASVVPASGSRASVESSRGPESG